MKLSTSIYDFSDYIEYLKSYQSQLANGGRGFQAHVAKHLRCQSAYVSRVFRGDTNFSLEQGILIASLVDLDLEEEAYFLLLIQYARAGLPQLREVFEHQIKTIQNKKNSVTGRMKATMAKKLDEITTKYFSNWVCQAVHVLVGGPYDQRRNWAKMLGVSENRVSEVLRFLEESEIIQSKKKRVQHGRN